MLTIVFTILMITVFGKMIWLAIRAAWGITGVLLKIVFLPVTLIFMALSGLIHIALFLLILIGIFSLATSATT